jgi:hypothetical protein
LNAQLTVNLVVEVNLRLAANFQSVATAQSPAPAPFAPGLHLSSLLQRLHQFPLRLSHQLSR